MGTSVESIKCEADEADDGSEVLVKTVGEN